MESVRLALEAMATRFEIVLQGPSARALRAAGEEALAEIERLEREISPYLAESGIAQANARAAFEPVRLSPAVFSLLKQAVSLSEATGGAFDVAAAPLVRAWGFMGGNGHPPDPEELRRAREAAGFQHLRLDEEAQTVRFTHPGAGIDVGAIGKGFAIDRAAVLLRDAGVERALLHGGTSTVCAIGRPFDAEAWKVTIDLPERSHRTGILPVQTRDFGSATRSEEPSGAGSRQDACSTLAVVPLRDETLSVSAVWGRSFENAGRQCGHVINPRTGEPVSGAVLAAVALPSATETDALSTALLVLGEAGLERILAIRPAARALTATPREAGLEIARLGAQNCFLIGPVSI